MEFGVTGKLQEERRTFWSSCHAPQKGQDSRQDQRGKQGRQAIKAGHEAHFGCAEEVEVIGLGLNFKVECQAQKSLGFVSKSPTIKVFKQVEAKRRLEQKKVDKTIATEEQIDTEDVEQVKSENKKVATASRPTATYAKHAGLEDFKEDARQGNRRQEADESDPTSTEEPVADVSAYKADVQLSDTKVVTNLAKTPATALVATCPASAHHSNKQMRKVPVSKEPPHPRCDSSRG